MLFYTMVTTLWRVIRNRSVDVVIALLKMERTLMNIWFWKIDLELNVVSFSTSEGIITNLV